MAICLMMIIDYILKQNKTNKQQKNSFIAINVDLFTTLFSIQLMKLGGWQRFVQLKGRIHHLSRLKILRNFNSQYTLQISSQTYHWKVFIYWSLCMKLICGRASGWGYVAVLLTVLWQQWLTTTAQFIWWANSKNVIAQLNLDRWIMQNCVHPSAGYFTCSYSTFSGCPLLHSALSPPVRKTQMWVRQASADKEQRTSINSS